MVEYIVAIDVTWVRLPSLSSLSRCQVKEPRNQLRMPGQARTLELGHPLGYGVGGGGVS